MFQTHGVHRRVCYSVKLKSVLGEINRRHKTYIDQYGRIFSFEQISEIYEHLKSLQ